MTAAAHFAVIVGIIALFFTLPARAALPDCASSVSPLVELSTEVAADSAVATSSLEDHLSAALGARGFNLCRGSVTPSPSVAELTIHVTADAAVVALIELRDAVTGKRVERSLELTQIPADGRPLAIASSADELLRASWAELTLIDAPPPVFTPPPAVQRALQSSLRPPAVPTTGAELGVEGSAAVQRYLTAFGVRVRLGYWLSPRFGLFFASSSASGLRRTAPHGAVSLGEIGLESGVAYAWRPIRKPWGGSVEGGASVLRLSFSASPGANAEANSFADWSLVSSARVRGWAGSARVRATLSLAALYAIRPSRAYDGTRIVTSNEGAGLEATAGVGFFF